jgi:hypothetical protein
LLYFIIHEIILKMKIQFAIPFLFSIFSLYNILIAQPSIQWQKSFGGSGYESARCIIQTNDGGYIIAGISGSNDGDVSGNHGDNDCWIVKIDNSGTLEWQKSIGGTNSDGASFIQQTIDGGYILVGGSSSNDGDVSGNHGGTDCWIVKIDSSGNLEWQKTIGGSLVDGGISLKQTLDSGYIVLGWSLSVDGDLTSIPDSGKAWLVKLNNIGNIQWQKKFGGPNIEDATDIQLASDSGFIVAGCYNYNSGQTDFWVIKFNSTGGMEWERKLGGSGGEHSRTIQQTSDIGFIVAGWCQSYDGDVTCYHGSTDSWIVKLDSLGVIQWNKCLGGSSGSEQTNSIQQTTSGGYIVANWARKNDGDVSGIHGNQNKPDYWIVSLDSVGTILWQKALGGFDQEYAYYIRQSIDGGYIIAGGSASNDGDVTGNHGGTDIWIVKLNPLVGIEEIKYSIIDFKINPNPFSDKTTISFQLSSKRNFQIEIHDIKGSLIRDFNLQGLIVGTNEFHWDATNNAGSKVENGIYFITIVSENISETRKVVLLKN